VGQVYDLRLLSFSEMKDRHRPARSFDQSLSRATERSTSGVVDGTRDACEPGLLFSTSG
jgi:hypothetical protein